MRNSLSPRWSKNNSFSSQEKTSPDKAMREFRNELDRFFRFGPQSRWSDLDQLHPASSMRENSHEYNFEMDIPGMTEKDVKIEVKGHHLIVSGERRHSREHEESNDNMMISESYYGSFTRSFTLASKVAEDKIEAQCMNGVLKIKVPKVAAEPSRNNEDKH